MLVQGTNGFSYSHIFGYIPTLTRLCIIQIIYIYCIIILCLFIYCMNIFQPTTTVLFHKNYYSFVILIIICLYCIIIIIVLFRRTTYKLIIHAWNNNTFMYTRPAIKVLKNYNNNIINNIRIFMYKIAFVHRNLTMVKLQYLLRQLFNKWNFFLSS